MILPSKYIWKHMPRFAYFNLHTLLILFSVYIHMKYIFLTYAVRMHIDGLVQDCGISIAYAINRDTAVLH